MSDLISRAAAIDAIYACYIGGKEAVDKAPANDQYAEGIDEAVCAVEELPSAEPEIKPIEYRDCANAMMKMWMDNVVTDREYNHIMDKLNAHWRKKNG